MCNRVRLHETACTSLTSIRLYVRRSLISLRHIITDVNLPVPQRDDVVVYSIPYEDHEGTLGLRTRMSLLFSVRFASMVNQSRTPPLFHFRDGWCTSGSP